MILTASPASAASWLFSDPFFLLPQPIQDPNPIGRTLATGAFRDVGMRPDTSETVYATWLDLSGSKSEQRNVLLATSRLLSGQVQSANSFLRVDHLCEVKWIQPKVPGALLLNPTPGRHFIVDSALYVSKYVIDSSALSSSGASVTAAIGADLKAAQLAPMTANVLQDTSELSDACVTNGPGASPQPPAKTPSAVASKKPSTSASTPAVATSASSTNSPSTAKTSISVSLSVDKKSAVVSTSGGSDAIIAYDVLSIEYMNSKSPMRVTTWQPDGNGNVVGNVGTSQIVFRFTSVPLVSNDFDTSQFSRVAFCVSMTYIALANIQTSTFCPPKSQIRIASKAFLNGYIAPGDPKSPTTRQVLVTEYPGGVNSARGQTGPWSQKVIDLSSLTFTFNQNSLDRHGQRILNSIVGSTTVTENLFTVTHATNTLPGLPVVKLTR